MTYLRMTTVALLLIIGSIGIHAQESRSVKDSCSLSIGDTHAGGIIFYLDASGCHGLVCTPTDQSSDIKWNNGESIDTYAYGNGIGNGSGNASAIGRWQGGCSSCYASLICYNVLIEGFRDWYLPSKYELNLMRENVGQGNALGLGNIGNFNAGSYWNSTEHSNVVAWYQNFTTGFIDGDLKTKAFSVRAVRVF
jgi:hypothetical protein